MILCSVNWELRKRDGSPFMVIQFLDEFLIPPGASFRILRIHKPVNPAGSMSVDVEYIGHED